MNGVSSERETLIAVQDNEGTSLRFSSHILISNILKKAAFKYYKAI